MVVDMIKKACKYLEYAYVPYSKFPVAALLVDEKGNEYYGVNVENASYPLGLCAERNAITTAKTNGMNKIKYIFVTGNTSEPISPCGACRQVISEFSDDETRIYLGNSNNDKYIELKINELLPYRFVPDVLK